MGMRDEFDTAYAGLHRVDFTTSPHLDEIPVFETTIRYLGGLLAAYDVSGGPDGEYPLLLAKAIELAEVLIGVFDTPNRMPALQYRWKGADAFRLKRVSTTAGMAELGSLSLEFTRLAQLTGQDKYYGGVARITNALEEWQERGDDTAPVIPGLFPERLDTSGCDQLATVAMRSKGPGGLPPAADVLQGSNNGLPWDWDCVPSNLTAAPGPQSFSIGASQDSAYEYFSKEYLLLGGRTRPTARCTSPPPPPSSSGCCTGPGSPAARTSSSCPRRGCPRAAAWRASRASTTSSTSPASWAECSASGPACSTILRTSRSRSGSPRASSGLTLRCRAVSCRSLPR